MTTNQRTEYSYAELRAMVGQEIGRSPWVAVTQQMIDRFADATDDHQFIHVDPARAAATQFGGTIAHGFLTVSLLSSFAHQALPLFRNAELGINKGFDRLRFVSPVHSGTRIRAIFVLAGLERRHDGLLDFAYDVTVEVEGSDKPAMIARWLTLNRVRLTGEAA